MYNFYKTTEVSTVQLHYIYSVNNKRSGRLCERAPSTSENVTRITSETFLLVTYSIDYSALRF